MTRSDNTTVYLDRMGSTPWGTFGRMILPGGMVFPTIEREWQHNAEGASCIPAGDYLMRQRQSPIVARTTKGAFVRGWQVLEVPGRDLIMVHPANWAHELQGCIAPGRAHAVIRGRPGVSSSVAAFTDMMNRLSVRDEWHLSIRWTHPEGA